MLLWLQKQPLHFWNLKCKRKPTRRSLPLESCQRLRHPPSTELLLRSLLQAFIFSVFYFFFIFYYYSQNPSWKWCLCVCVCVPHWGSKWQAGSITTGLIARWRDSVWLPPNVLMLGLRRKKVLRNKSQGGWRGLVWSSPRGGKLPCEDHTQSSPIRCITIPAVVGTLSCTLL